MARISNAIIFAIFIIKCANAGVCRNENSCLCELDDYNKIDITKVTNDFLEDGDSNGNTFYFHGCTDGLFNTSVHHIKPNHTKPAYTGSLILAHVDPSNDNKTFINVTGNSSQMKFFAINGEKNSYEIVYKNGETVTANIRLICISGDVSFIKILKIDGPNPLLALSSPYACVITHHSGLSTGSVFLIILFITSAVYFIGGGTVLYFVRGARGLEIIPNIDFWRSLPGLVKDGIIFLFSGCNPTSITTPETYDRI